LGQRVELRPVRFDFFDDAMRADSETVAASFELKTAASTEAHWIGCGQKEK
jgi:hypothetical protein